MIDKGCCVISERRKLGKNRWGDRTTLTGYDLRKKGGKERGEK